MYSGNLSSHQTDTLILGTLEFALFYPKTWGETLEIAYFGEKNWELRQKNVNL